MLKQRTYESESFPCKIDSYSSLASHTASWFSSHHVERRVYNLELIHIKGTICLLYHWKIKVDFTSKELLPDSTLIRPFSAPLGKYYWVGN